MTLVFFHRREGPSVQAPILLLPWRPPWQQLSLPVPVMQNKEKCRKKAIASLWTSSWLILKGKLVPRKKRQFLKKRDLFPRQLGFWEMPSVMSAASAKSLWQHLQGHFQAPKCLRSLFVSSLNEWNSLIHQRGLLVPAFLLTKLCLWFRIRSVQREAHPSGNYVIKDALGFVLFCFVIN